MMVEGELMSELSVVDDFKKDYVYKLYPDHVQNRNVFLNILQNCNRKEIQYKKNVFDFNITEIENLIRILNINTYRTARFYIGAIKGYINYCIEMGYASKNVIDEVYSTTWLRSFLPPGKLYLTDRALDEIVDKCKNFQDAALLQLLFEGVCGKQKSELLNLKVADIKGNNIRLNDNGKLRVIKVSDKCINLINKANEEVTYQVKNGQIYPLIPSEFVIKRTSKGRQKLAEIDYTKDIVHRRLSTIANVMNIKEKSPKYIMDSGKIALAKNSYEKYGYFAEENALVELSRQFNIKSKQILRDFTNQEVIFDVYNIEFPKSIVKPYQIIDESLKDTTDSRRTTIIGRDKQDKFRDNILLNYDGKCCISGESVNAVIESAHIQRYINDDSHHVQNGLLLRADLHKLLDKGLMTIDENYSVLISHKVTSSFYQSLNGKKITLPINKNCHPSKVALQLHRNIFKENFCF
jgi:integrase